jgi:hypothetical protein
MGFIASTKKEINKEFKMMLPYTITEHSITVLLQNIPAVVDKSHPNFKEILEAVKEGNEEKAYELINIAKTIESKSFGEVEVRGGVVYYKDQILENYAVDKLLEFIAEDYTVTPIINFIKNLMDNPSYRAVKELYKFLEVGGIPLTDDGCFVVYKKVKSNYFDIYSGTYNNSVGSIVEMPRNQVNEDSSQTCSAGLHVCSFSYLGHFGSSEGNKVVACKVNPADVVSIPNDYNNTKMRVCKYEVVADVTDSYNKSLDVLSTNAIYSFEFDDEENVDEVVSTHFRSVVQMDAKTDAVIAIYASIAEAEEITGIFATNISKVCRGYRYTAGGYSWRYYE